MTLKVPEATVIRVSAYSRFLEQLDKRGVTTVLSSEIAQKVGVKPGQVRKDLSYFGEFGTRGIGYNVKDLMHYTFKILSLNSPWPLVLFGAGNVGKALCSFKGFNERGFSIVGVFDNDLTKIGKKIGNLDVYPLEKASEVIKRQKVRVGIIAVPKPAAQGVADLLVSNSVQAILNFARVPLNIPEKIIVQNVDLSVNLEILTFKLGTRETAYIAEPS